MSQPQTQQQQRNSRQKHPRKIKFPRAFNHLRKKSSQRSCEKIPTSQEMLDLANLGDPELSNKTLSLIHALLPDWNDIRDATQLRIESVSGALTNRVFFVTAPSAKPNNSLAICRSQETTKLRRVLLRVYGVGVEMLLERAKELRFLKMLSTLNIGPRLLGIFKNGRFEEYLDCTPLTPNDLRNPETSRHIAERMATLHHIVETFPPPDGTVPEVWVNIDKWYDLVIASEENDPVRKKRLHVFNLKLLKLEIERLKKFLTTFNCPLVVAHNDTQYGNILRLNDKSRELVVVDFEYAGYNYAPFDIANHFCEWMFNFHSPDPHVMRLDLYPNLAQRTQFLVSYIETERSLRGEHMSIIEDDREGGEVLNQKIKECEAFVLASHVMWGLWGLVQAGHSHIMFDYFEYGMQRLEEFRKNLRNLEN